ncbi:AlpA family transcriptional regulator [Rhizobium leguminosarum]|uniref:AlpA family phage regulatory protein n=1 Tax=Rhizobium leguminosarum TaxID=384 RepID=A0A7K3VFW8_RHILE|nr:AlpA family transcriptional regulator [Rhizobium leguminosarum]NEK15692.1 AlpA family phage regulatory protein [Rhizobium leguminosarum]
MIDRHLRLPAVIEATGMSRSTIYDMMSKGTFPRPVHLGKRLVAWPESAVANWLAERTSAMLIAA